jgi:dihydroorotate dehydrogenase (NAD+) catalytic subunit
MIHLSNGFSFEYMAASGALAFDGRGWPWEQPLRWLGLLDPKLFAVVIKTLTHLPRRGNLRMYNPLGCIRLICQGTVNAVGLTNPGIEWWCNTITPEIEEHAIPLIGSIFSDNIDELAWMAKRISFAKLEALEVNTSCPNTRDDLLGNTQKVIAGIIATRENTDFPLIIKLSVVQDYATIIKEVAGCIEAISINSVPWKVFSPDQPSPLQHLGGGGVSGRAVQRHTWEMVSNISKMTDIPVIGPSVWEYEDIARLRSLGAQAISFGSIFLRYPWRPTMFVRQDMKERQASE